MEFEINNEVKSIIRVIGVGGAGGNAVTNMYESGIKGVDFAICNTDNQDLENSSVKTKIQLGPSLLSGLGAGNKAQVGREACLESIEDIRKYLQDSTKMLFLTAGMGGGTGTGASPIIAKVAQELGVLTIGIVTLPFGFEGPMRMRQAADGLAELRDNVDALIVISNDKLRETYGNMSMKDALAKADEVLCESAKGIAEIITLNGDINIDFNDVDTVMRSSGVAILGTGLASGENRARKAVQRVLTAPLLADNDIRGAKNVLINIVSGEEPATLDEITEISSYVQEEAGFETNVIWGNVSDDTLGDEISVTVIATGFEQTEFDPRPVRAASKEEPIMVDLDAEVSMPVTKPKEQPAAATMVSKPQIELKTTTDAHTMNRLNHTRSSYGDPYVKSEQEQAAPSTNKTPRTAPPTPKPFPGKAVRDGQARKITNPDVLDELEKVPAYERRHIELDDLSIQGDEILSNLTLLGEDDDFQMISENSFIHKKVD